MNHFEMVKIGSHTFALSQIAFNSTIACMVLNRGNTTLIHLSPELPLEEKCQLLENVFSNSSMNRIIRKVSAAQKTLKEAIS